MLKRFLVAACAAAFIVAGGGAAQAFDVSKDDGNLWLVNHTHKADLNYLAGDMQRPVYAPALPGVYMRAQAAAAYTDLYRGLIYSRMPSVKVHSAFRSVGEQGTLFQTWMNNWRRYGLDEQGAFFMTNLYVAQPGHSEHQLGLAIDVGTSGVDKNSFATHPSGVWMRNNAWRYGYILRYPPDKTDITHAAFEPWHFRYVGAPHAEIMVRNNWCLEEYIAKLREQKETYYQDSYGNPWRIYWVKDSSKDYPGTVSISSDNTGGYIVTTRA